MTEKGHNHREEQYRETIALLHDERSLASLRKLTSGTLARTEAAVINRLTGAEPLACEAGCAFCCYLMATISGPEALHIAAELRERLTPEALQALNQRVRQAHRLTETSSNRQRIAARVACPFLGIDAQCSIYAFRPLDCVTHHSRSRVACESLLASGVDERPTDPEITNIGREIKTGLGQGLYAGGLEIPTQK